jgi:hypothetical protein
VPQHVVQQGECVSSIAKHYGFEWKRIWNLAENSNLRLKRKNPNILHPGDTLFVPEKQPRNEDRSTDAVHQFRLKGTPCKLRIRLLSAGKPMANEPYKLIVGTLLEGTTDGDGLLEQIIPEEATSGKLLVGKHLLELRLDIGHLDPITEVSGVQARLNNLGFHCGPVDGLLGPMTRSAIYTFQETYDLEMTGAPDQPTQDKLKERHGC